MSFSSHDEQRGERVLDVLSNDETGTRIVVARLGAELISLARWDGNAWQGFLHRDDQIDAAPPGWANHATVMGYFLHRLKDGRSQYRGQEIAGGTHSFLRTKEWKLDASESKNGRLTYEMRQADFTAEEYPLNVSLRLTYELSGETLRVIFHFQNHEVELAAHVGFGLHPGFAITPGGAYSCRMPAGTYRRHFSPNNYLAQETQTFFFSGGQMPVEQTKLPGSFILELVDVPQRNFHFHDEASGRTVALDLREVPYVTLWSDGGPFLCVEPCWGLTDHDAQRPFENKEGIHLIAAGGELQRSFAITPQLTPRGPH